VAIVTSDKVKLVEIGEITDVSSLIDYARAAHIRNFTQAERDRFFIARSQTHSSSMQPLDDTAPLDAVASSASAIDAATGSRPAENPDGCATPWHHSDLAKSFHQQGDLRTALFHYAIASARFAETGAEREAALDAFRRGSLARTLPKSEVIAVWREAQEAMAADCVRTAAAQP
jgi:hypothetical protein